MAATELWRPNIMAIGPGGAKAFLELGALLKFETSAFLQSVEHWIGCSAGAAIALLLTAGYTVAEIIRESLTIDLLKDITDIESFGDIINKRGLFSNRHIEVLLKKKIEDKFGFELTLKQLFYATGKKLTVVTYNVDMERPEYLSKDTEPNLSCVTAIMMSIAMPIIMQPRIHNKCSYIDGALGNPYPVDIHDDGENKVVGIYITTVMQTEASAAGSLIRYLDKIAHASMNQLRTRIIEQSSSNCKHLALYSNIMDATGLSLSDSQKEELMREGYKTAERFIMEIDHPTQKLDMNETLIEKEPVEMAFNEEKPILDGQDLLALDSMVQGSNKITVPITAKIQDILRAKFNRQM